jgi:NADH-quinone oxidoreductase subunit N
MLPIDTTQFRFDLLAPELVLIVFGFITLLIGVYSEKSENRSYAGLLAVSGIAISGLLAMNLFGVTAEGFYGAIHIDGFAIYLKLLILAGALITALVSIDYLKQRNVEVYEYYTLLIFATSGMMLLVSASDLISMLISIEIMSLAIYVLVGIRRDEPFSTEAAFKYFVLGSFASGIIVYGIALVYGATQSFNMAEIAGAFETGTISEPTLFMAGMGMLLVGFAFKVASVPFHMWAPDVYQGAPAPITGFMAVGVKAAAFAAAIRVFHTAFGANFVDWQPIIWWLAVLSMVGGNLMALMQENIKRMLAYSSIAHAGYLLIGLAIGTDQAIGAMLYYLTAYTFMSLGAFAVITAVSAGENELENLSDWSGLGFRYPMLGAVMAMCMFSMGGIPPMAGFFAKFYLFLAAVQAGDVPLVIIAVLASAISLYFYLKVIVYLYMKEPERELLQATPNLSVQIGVIIAAAGVLYLGLLPGTVLNWAVVSVTTLF